LTRSLFRQALGHKDSLAAAAAVTAAAATSSPIMHLQPIRKSTSGSDSRAVLGVEGYAVQDPLNAASNVSGSALSKEFKRHFKEILPDLIRDLTYEDGEFKDLPGQVNAHVAKCLQYNLAHGKLNRGLAVPVSYRLLTGAPPSGDAAAAAANADQMRKACVLGWCIELMQAYFLVADDMMDGSETRRGKPCWYKKEGIGMMAINDALILEASIFALLNKHFKNHPYYHTAVDNFLKVIRLTTMGQSLDMLSQLDTATTTAAGKAPITLDDFNMKRYTNIVTYKTAYYSFYLPVQVGMGLAGIEDAELYRQAKRILLETGKFFQVQDDYLDCFGDPEVTGKVGTDIQDGKCSWLIVMAMQRASPKQKQALKDSYGKDDAESVARIKSLYGELNLAKAFHSYEERSYNDILQLISQMPGGGSALNPEVFYYFLNAIHKRNK